jgi:spore photoproduct lyase
MTNFKISGVLTDDLALNTPMGQKFRRHLPKVISETSDCLRASKDILAKDMLHLKAFKGDFLKPCPGTRNYICCGYQILNIATNCPLDCSYCILQSYFINQPGLRIHVNLEEKIESIMAEIDQHPQKIVRVGTGEFADSLALDPMAGWTGILMPHFPAEKTRSWNLRPKRTIFEVCWNRLIGIALSSAGLLTVRGFRKRKKRVPPP